MTLTDDTRMRVTFKCEDVFAVVPRVLDQIRRIGIGLDHLAVRPGAGFALVEIELGEIDETIGRNLCDRIDQMIGVSDLSVAPHDSAMTGGALDGVQIPAVSINT